MTVVKIRFVPGLKPIIEKHAEHDQSTHGSWANSGSPKLTIIGKNDGTNEYFNENTRVVRYQPEGKKPKDYVLYAQKEFVVSLEKPTDGTTINGYSEGKRNKGEVGHLDITGPGSNPWRSSAKDDGKATIVEVAVMSSHQRRGLASAMLRFHRDLYPELDVQHSDALLPEGKAWADVSKHAMHDQSTHGNWAGSKTGAGNNLSIEEVLKLHSKSDPLVQKVYSAENKLDDKKIDRSTKPVAPIRQGSSPEDWSEYEKAFKEYRKNFTEWAVEQQANILSDKGKKHLDGSPKGVKKYVEEIVKENWFVEKFGDGSSFPPLEVKTANTNASGRHIVGVRRERATGKILDEKNIISIDRGHTKHEPTILHEISHYATAISQTKPFSGHGVEFAKNHIYVVSKAVGPERASRLRESYIAEGVRVDD